ncbi:hypothetical protein A2778_00515 [Candidatus Daviesbacteria bacterium RIFCSPHIGHO2_01_FULL_40_24]|nr:MAG: hypothetical protein A2778_00515 [Candidatus Daviesbacteria bacterium RIFCSPHIGHO2_01_FULL_40_24]OGE28402.1 MAG: hypothetical protein A3C29_05510 [Candidatus Daviesbacteria bacterium RIFCSPHIGHO2_02_FULL_40_16]OGE42033.1 MAG: hypothetical protein A3A53_04015 [Candidatus Daviesbacteria bacterium RIFCSPLOWO2_01_FULL_39_23]OGE66157.1 MAG: hypothetical protein A3J16_04300 [Candidatus Daviesbacteria bacterium RIFCSPLOWO2_02_FULL_39_13]HCE31152.1 hypothetical protein [Candidatus Daviesbacteri
MYSITYRLRIKCILRKKEVIKEMVTKTLIGMGTLIIAFAITLGLALAQSPSPTATASPAASPQAPAGAPATGMGY